MITATVVIPTWNRATFLPGCLGSLANQDYPMHSWEVVVVDDGSTDETASTMAFVARDLEASGLHVHYERRPHEGLNAARNAGIALAKGELICFLDDDVITPTDWLSSMVRGIAGNPGAAAYGGPIDLVLEGPVPRSCGREELGETVQDCGPDVCEPETLFGSNLTVTAAAIRMFGVFDTELEVGDETEWLLRVRDGGGRLLYLPQAVVHHRRRAEDLRMRVLAARRFRRGRAQIQFGVVTGAPYSARTEAVQLTRSLAHSVRHRCALGLLPVAMSAGRLAGLAWARRPRASR